MTGDVGFAVLNGVVELILPYRQIAGIGVVERKEFSRLSRIVVELPVDGLKIRDAVRLV